MLLPVTWSLAKLCTLGLTNLTVSNLALGSTQPAFSSLASPSLICSFPITRLCASPAVG